MSLVRATTPPDLSYWGTSVLEDHPLDSEELVVAKARERCLHRIQAQKEEEEWWVREEEERKAHEEEKRERRRVEREKRERRARAQKELARVRRKERHAEEVGEGSAPSKVSRPIFSKRLVPWTILMISFGSAKSPRSRYPDERDPLVRGASNARFAVYVGLVRPARSAPG